MVRGTLEHSFHSRWAPRTLTSFLRIHLHLDVSLIMYSSIPSPVAWPDSVVTLFPGPLLTLFRTILFPTHLHRTAATPASANSHISFRFLLFQFNSGTLSSGQPLTFSIPNCTLSSQDAPCQPLMMMMMMIMVKPDMIY